MRTPRLFLGVFALALLLPLLLLACGGSDEPTDGPASGRATDEPTDLPDLKRATDEPETPASPGRTPSTPGSGDAPTATDATAPPAPSGPAETDREALVALYNAADGEGNWPNQQNWLSDAPLDEWDGVTTNDDGRVIELVLAYNGLRGEIPAELGSLSNLEELFLGGNGLSGDIPPELASLANLTELGLAGNYQLSGCVPSSLEDQLDFDESDIGGLPFCTSGSAETDREALVALYNATDGENWDASYNWLSDAPLGEWHGVTTNDDGRVTELYFHDNGLSGEIPAELGSLSNLEELGLVVNNLSGEIPPELGNLANLTQLYLGGNQLSGEIPPELGNLANLIQLGLWENQLSGEIPPELGNLANLIHLVLSGNQLSGEIPPWLGSLTSLDYLDLSGNQLTGCVPSSLEHRLNFDYSDLGDLPFC